MSITLSSYHDTDREEILAVWSRALPLDAVSIGTFESRVLLDENFDPQCFVIARENGVMAGCILGMYANKTALGDADPKWNRSWITVLAVDPPSNFEYVGSALLKELEQRFKQCGKKECWVSTYPPGYFTPGIDQNNYAPLLDLFLSHGYRKEKEALSMDASIVAFRMNDTIIRKEEELRTRGIVIRQYQRSDLMNFLAFLEKTMPFDWVRVERGNLRKLSEGGFYEHQITVVEHDGDIIGYCQFEGAHFGPFGVSDAFQGQGIGTVLLARTLERMRIHGFHNAWVMWTDDIAAKVYRKFGFTETRRFSILSKKL